MKDKILMLVIGILIGAIITAGCFLIFNKTNTNTQNGMPSGTPPTEMGNFVGGHRGPMDSTSTTGDTANQTTTSTTTNSTVANQ